MKLHRIACLVGLLFVPMVASAETPYDTALGVLSKIAEGHDRISVLTEADAGEPALRDDGSLVRTFKTTFGEGRCYAVVTVISEAELQGVLARRPNPDFDKQRPFESNAGNPQKAERDGRKWEEQTGWKVEEHRRMHTLSPHRVDLHVLTQPNATYAIEVTGESDRVMLLIRQSESLEPFAARLVPPARGALEAEHFTGRLPTPTVMEPNADANAGQVVDRPFAVLRVLSGEEETPLFSEEENRSPSLLQLQFGEPVSTSQVVCFTFSGVFRDFGSDPSGFGGNSKSATLKLGFDRSGNQFGLADLKPQFEQEAEDEEAKISTGKGISGSLVVVFADDESTRCTYVFGKN